MAKVNVNGASVKSQVNRPGVHAKSKMSKLKSSKNYTKKYSGQGK